MHTTVTIPAGMKKDYAVPSYIVRYIFPFDEVICRYGDTEQKVKFKGHEMDRGKLDLFWKQIYQNCQDFRTLRQSSKLPLVTFYVGFCMFLLGLLLLILGVVPIWGKQKMSLAMIIISGIVIVLSALTHILTKVFIGYYYNRKLYPRYEDAIIKAVHEHFHDYIGSGMSWRGGADGFRCIEFSYSADEQADTVNVTNYNKVDTVMYSETTEIFKKDVSADMSSLFKPSGDQADLIKGPPKNLKKGQLRVGIAPRHDESSANLGSSKINDLASSKIALFEIGSNTTMNMVRESNNFDHPSNDYELPAKRRNILDNSIPEIGSNTNRRADGDKATDGKSIDFDSKAV